MIIYGVALLAVCTLAGVGFGYRVGVLGPAPRVGLIGKEDGRRLLGFGGSVPSVGLLEKVAGAFFSGRRPSGTGKKEQQGGAHGAGATLSRFLRE